ncbi:hypothetical protein NDU88_005050 [Pleurodeles waltl]|uniref:Uncharacterized protein n=1 Tax=Pleurodeles waltl TaxID=8319 RepID=A0AAV7SKQ1_PLEWA|nr:hypothetical protein NDU88_005050 [Pleurodeles waltl]
MRQELEPSGRSWYSGTGSEQVERGVHTTKVTGSGRCGLPWWSWSDAASNARDKCAGDKQRPRLCQGRSEELHSDDPGDITLGMFLAAG